MIKGYLTAALMAVTVGGIGLGTRVSHGTDHANSRPTQSTASSSRLVPASLQGHMHYARNAHDQTYGSDSPPGTESGTSGQAKPAMPVHEPDLVLVVDTQGHEGYVYASQMNGPAPANPAEAAAMGSPKPRTIPVYTSNGTTVIGTFIVGGGARRLFIKSQRKDTRPTILGTGCRYRR